MKKIRESIAFKCIAIIVLILLVFATLVSNIGYTMFSEAAYEQFTEEAFDIADSSARVINADQMEAYRESGGEGEEYRRIWTILDQICNGSGATFIYVIQPDLSDYGQITFIFSTVDHDSEYSPYEVGYIRPTTNDEYRQKYRALYEGESDRELLLLQSRSYVTSLHHITVMVPLRGSDGQTKAILCVQRQLSTLTELRRDYRQTVLRVVLMLTVLVILGEGLFLNRALILPVRKITEEASRFASENVIAENKLTETVRSRDEIGVLAGSIDRMESQIVSYVDNLTRMTAERERISAELDIAKKIQASMLPSVFPPFPERKDFDIYASMDPAREVGGDFYDFFLVDEDHLALVIADVSGKGIPAALFMARAKDLIRKQVSMGSGPAEALGIVNPQLCDGNDNDMFVTVWLAVVELSTGRGVSANAGHEHPALRRAGGDYELVVYRHSPALGVFDSLTFRDRSFELRPGDSIFVYTDGVAEATSLREELFGTDRMLEALNEDPGAAPEQLLQTVRERIDAFVGEAPQFDDITMLCFRYNGPEAR